MVVPLPARLSHSPLTIHHSRTSTLRRTLYRVQRCADKPTSTIGRSRAARLALFSRRAQV